MKRSFKILLVIAVILTAANLVGVIARTAHTTPPVADLIWDRHPV